MRINGSREVLLREFLDALDGVDSAADALQEHLRIYRSAIQDTVEYLEAGGSIPGVIAARPAGVARSAKEPMRQLNDARTRAQHAVFRLAVVDGMNAGEIGRAWNVSRQLVSRILNDSKRKRRTAIAHGLCVCI